MIYNLMVHKFCMSQLTDNIMKPFNGILYNEEKAGNITDLVCPPYDVIEDAAPYFEKGPFNAIRLELPRDLPDGDKYNLAKATMDKWLTGGVLLTDPREALYAYEQEFTIGPSTFRRKGFIALHKLDKQRILTHEQTRKKAKADREQLIGTLKTYTSFIFGLYNDREKIVDSIIEKAPKEEIFDFTDEESIRNRFYRVIDTSSIDSIASFLEEKYIYIADGHHRLNVSYRLGVPYVPFYLTNMYDPGIVILPYHRMVTFERKRPAAECLRLLEPFMTIEKHTFEPERSLPDALSAVAGSTRTAFAFFAKDDPSNLYVATEKTALPIHGSNGLHESLRKLKVNVIHSGIIQDIMKVHDDEISFTQDWRFAIDSVLNGPVDAAFFLPPTTVDEVKDIAENGLDMPPKSTFFYPKILTGLVFYKYA